MANVNIVGKKNSFTFIACDSRYPGYDHEYVGHTHDELVTGLLNKTISRSEPSLVPLWNSNAGTINMGKETQTAQVFLGKAGNIFDLWPEQIIFQLGVAGNGALSKDCRIYSVKVAKEQCSKFLNETGVYQVEDRLKGSDTTTIAADDFKSKGRTGDGLLCSSKLLSDQSLSEKGDKANSYNFTVFSTVNVLPKSNPTGKRYSLAAVLVNLSGDKIPVDFANYWQQLFLEQEAEAASSVVDEIPKILFIIRYEEARALLLMEMPSTGLESPWPTPDLDLDLGVELNNSLVSLEQVGGISESYTKTERTLFLEKFRIQETEIIFYSNEATYVWASPALNIFVHGFDPSLVKECARLQVNRLVQIMNYGITLPTIVIDLLSAFVEDQSKLKLGLESQPDTP